MKAFFQISLVIVMMSTTFSSFGQIPKHIFNEITEQKFSPKDFTTKSKPIRERLGIYHFGESEGEWDLIIISNGDSLIVQIWNGQWGKNALTRKETWLSKCQTYNKVTVVDNKFFFGEFSGIFAEFKEGKKMTNSLLLLSDPIVGRNYGKDSAEVGFINNLSTIESFYKFKAEKNYYKLSTSIQPDIFFTNRSKQELKIMRNSIYAKYGLIFQTGGEMENYFSKKVWYTPYLKDVSKCLTEIEKRNLQTIARIEQM
jgi:hypothetical protein